VARAVRFTRTYLPVPVTGSACTPPVPVVVVYTVDHEVAFAETCTEKPRA
jgi:hypothetical protein